MEAGQGSKSSMLKALGRGGGSPHTGDEVDNPPGLAKEDEQQQSGFENGPLVGVREEDTFGQSECGVGRMGEVDEDLQAQGMVSQVGKVKEEWQVQGEALEPKQPQKKGVFWFLGIGWQCFTLHSEWSVQEDMEGPRAAEEVQEASFHGSRTREQVFDA